MTIVAGIDGCRAGWVIVAIDDVQSGPSPISGTVCPTLARALDLVAESPAVVLDVPIGLLDHAEPGGRTADVIARKLLAARGSSVFPAPARRVLAFRSWEEANAVARSDSRDGIGITRQAFAILPKVREADEAMTPERQERVVEGHPELSFRAMNGDVPLSLTKRSAGGMLLRLRLLEQVGLRSAAEYAAETAGKDARMDDVLDATALAWSALRVVGGTARRIPERPPVDARGLRMEMWF
ncbi:MAG: DUF429 domain-containing protein [Gemmatimonadales bacterium]